jgi:hypothetical protein
MPTYSVVPRADGAGHDVQVTDDIGGRHTILGFATEAAAQAWITEDRRADALRKPNRSAEAL